MSTLNKKQQELLNYFYSQKSVKIVYRKRARDKIWKAIKNNKEVDIKDIESKCPTLAHQIIKSYENGTNIQSAVFSECVYTQAYAQMLNLKLYPINESYPQNILNIINKINLHARYVYTNDDFSLCLLQAGGCNGCDCALINNKTNQIYYIEFKEPWAKTSEHDLSYDEKGYLVVTDKFKEKYPQFIEMLNEHKNLNIFENLGHNITDFTEESVKIAIRDNYKYDKKVDVICTEDRNGVLVMLSIEDATEHTEISGEIRTCGRNDYRVWTPKYLEQCIKNINGIIKEDVVINLSKFGKRHARGGKTLTGYKINQLFFVRREHSQTQGDCLSFNIQNIRQIKPTIAGKISFKKIQYKDFKNKYYNLQ